MNVAKQYHTADYTPHATQYYDPFNINALILNILADRTLSRGASDILAELVRLSGIKGYCYPSIQYLAITINKGRTQTKLYLKELVTKNRIRVIRYVGEESRYYVLDIPRENRGPGRFSDHRKEYKNKENVIERANVILNFHDQQIPLAHSACEQVVEKKPSPTLAVDNTFIITSMPPSNTDADPAAPKTNIPSAVFDMGLVREILEVTGDKKSVGCFIKIVKNVPQNIIYAALSSLKVAMSECYISRPGAYFVQVVKNYYPDMFNIPQTRPAPSPTSYESITAPVKEVSTPIDWQSNHKNLRIIRAMLDSSLSSRKGFI